MSQNSKEVQPGDSEANRRASYGLRYVQRGEYLPSGHASTALRGANETRPSRGLTTGLNVAGHLAQRASDSLASASRAAISRRWSSIARIASRIALMVASAVNTVAS